ncbi:MAG: hypothetical protein CK425_10720 [Parachlamydia sp.]|nr:MAG: hypothetical protein CK425_10720 [Parachlamydia sp.]
MNTNDRRDGGNLSIIEAVEALSHIADLEIDKGIGITQQHDLVFQNLPISYRTVHWLHPDNAETTISLVKDIFKVVLNYLHNFYKTQYRYITDENAVEEIKSIMVLVGEAAKKLDKYTSIFNRKVKSSVTDTKEYKELEDFYLTHIARKIDSGVLGKWILGIAKKHLLKETKPAGDKQLEKKAKYIFVDLESVKKDTEYELFFLRKEDGSRFFNSRLIRNVKLLCDFGGFFGESSENDLLADMRFHYDLHVHGAARNILRVFGSRIDQFYKECRDQPHNELINSLQKAFMALMICGHDGHLLRNSPTKSCIGYFQDFQGYLQEALQTREYQKLVAYPEEADATGSLLLETTQFLCKALYVQIKSLQGFMSSLKNLIREARELHLKDPTNHIDLLWKRLASDHAALTKIFKTHKHGPLIQVLESLESDGAHEFDPFHQGNIPDQLYTLFLQNTRCTNIRFPTPTHQELINKASIGEEFKAFLRSYKQAENELLPQRGHLLFNLQDKTSWKEHARASVIEDLQKHSDFSSVLTVVTLPKDTEFYHQLAPYHHDNHASAFLAHFKEHLQDASTGYYFPEALHEKLFSGFTDQLLETIHRLFFSNKNVLSRESRLDFIEIFHLFLELKILDILKPQTFSFTCKDGLDSGAAENAKLFALMKLLTEPQLTEAEYDYLNLLMHGPVILIRERHLLFERFSRLNSVIRLVETLKSELGHENFVQIMRQAFGPFFDSPILEPVILLPQPLESDQS